MNIARAKSIKDMFIYFGRKKTVQIAFLIQCMHIKNIYSTDTYSQTFHRIVSRCVNWVLDCTEKQMLVIHSVDNQK